MKNAHYIASGLVGLVVLGLIVGIVSSWLPPGAHRIAADSYSGMATGQRALFETLQALGVNVRRHGDVPSLLFEGERCVVLLEPDFSRLEREKGYLDQMRNWVEAGGRLVVVSNTLKQPERPSWKRRHPHDDERPSRKETFLEHLDLEGLTVAAETAKENEYQPSIRFKRVEIGGAVSKTCAARAAGSLAPVGASVKELAVSDPFMDYFEGEPVKHADGLIEIETEEDVWQPIAAEYRRGSGSVIVVADPAPFSNGGIGKSDNGVLAYLLTVGGGAREVLVDEFYHGARTEGSIPALLGMYPYGVVALFILAAVLSWVWSNGVRFGPIVPHEAPSRRSVLEYVDAMARLFRKGGKAPFALHTCREGFLNDLRAEFQIDLSLPETFVLERIGQIDPGRAEHIRAALGDIDTALHAREHINPRQLVNLQEKLESCRSTSKSSPFSQRRTLSTRYTVAL